MTPPGLRAYLEARRREGRWRRIAMGVVVAGLLLLLVSMAQADAITRVTLDSDGTFGWVGIHIDTAEGGSAFGGYGYYSWDSETAGWHAGQVFNIFMAQSGNVNNQSYIDYSTLRPGDFIGIGGFAFFDLFVPITTASTFTLSGPARMEAGLSGVSVGNLSIVGTGTGWADFIETICPGEGLPPCYAINHVRAELLAPASALATQTVAVPDVATALLLVTGLAGLWTVRRRAA
jgi:hypothetical protein